MRDFPVFSTENGVGSLILKEIPYSGIAYIKILDASAPTDFLKECVDFCKMAGCKKIYASGHEMLEEYPYTTSIWKMRANRGCLPETEAALFPVTEKTSHKWMEIYNEKMQNIPNASHMSLRDMDRLIQEGGGYFVHIDDTLLGIGKISSEQIDCVISLRKGAGEQVVAALNHGISGEYVQLEVASTNTKAVTLYERLGFIKTAEISRWYEVL